MAIPPSFTFKAAGILRDITTPIDVAPTPPHPIPADQQVFTPAVALWDTGATGSCITAELAARIGAIPIGKTLVRGAHGEARMNVYMIDFMLPNKVRIQDIRATEVVSTAGGFGVIVGMDVITLGDFCITNAGGSTVFTYRLPALKVIDFEDVDSVVNYPDMPRITSTNAATPLLAQTQQSRCFCGSGKKYKHCHGSK